MLSGRPDLYRAFMAQAWKHAGDKGYSGLIHLETHFTDDKATAVRQAAYSHLRRHWQFINELSLFEIQHQKRYGVNIYGPEHAVDFLQAASLYHPDTIQRSFAHNGEGDEPGTKDPEGAWDQRPHLGRIQRVDADTLRTWQEAFEWESPQHPPMLYTVNSASSKTLLALSRVGRARNLSLQYSAGWNETTDRERGRFAQSWGEAATWPEAILQGSHIYPSRPLYKWPNATMRNHRDWTDVDLEALHPNALPVTSFKPSGDNSAYDGSSQSTV